MYKILVVDNEKDVLATLVGIPKDEGHDVVGVLNERDAIEALNNEKFHIAFVDVRLQGDNADDISGIGLAAILRSMSPETLTFLMSGYPLGEPYLRIIHYVTEAVLLEKRDIDSMMLTAIAQAEQLSAVKDKTAITPSVDIGKGLAIESRLDFTRLAISLAPHQPAFARSYGKHVAAVRTAGALELRLERYARRVTNARRDPNNLRFEVKDIGKDLWRDVISDHPEIQTTFTAARSKSSLLSLLFEGPREYMRLPIEFAHMSGPDDYLILRHPVARFINGAETTRSPINREFFQQKPKLKALLVASNTEPNIPGVDREIERLDRFFQAQKQFPVETTVIPTEEATIARIRNELRNQEYDLIHYAGHGWFEVSSPEDSTLSFWRKPDKKGGVDHMKATEFRRLSDSNVRLVYLSSCWGAAVGTEKDLLDDDFLGLADVIAQAGVPTILGYRWPVSDARAPQLAEAFYEALLEDGRPDVALWRARRELAAMDPNDLTWLSPILIHQV